MSEPAFQPIARSPLYEQVAERLQTFIEAERLQPGDRLMSERELAEQLGVSRTSVRQALTALKVMGVVEIRHGDGVYLLRASSDLISGLAAGIAGSEADHPMIWEVREGIEVQAARLAAERRTGDDLAAMRRALEAMDASVAAGGDGIEGDRDFHHAIAHAAHNPLLQELTERLSDAIDRTSAASLTHAGRPPISLEHHRAILDAIERGDAVAAAERMHEHVEGSRVSVAGGSPHGARS